MARCNNFKKSVTAGEGQKGKKKLKARKQNKNLTLFPYALGYLREAGRMELAGFLEEPYANWLAKGDKQRELI